MVILRSSKLWFPEVTKANAEGLLALGGDLSVPRLLLAYRSGIFPWADDPLSWWAPDPRAIFQMDRFEPSQRLQQRIRNCGWRITRDQAFREVMTQCAVPRPGRESTWISRRFIDSYTRLHEEGHAHSLEIWDDDQLIGGIYGVAIGGFFAGESMFHRATDASKVALYHLFQHLLSRGFVLFDTQVLSPVTARLGAVEIRRADYMKRLQAALELPVRF